MIDRILPTPGTAQLVRAVFRFADSRGVTAFAVDTIPLDLIILHSLASYPHSFKQKANANRSFAPFNMHSKVLAVLLLIAPALAMPQATATATLEGYSESSGSSDSIDSSDSSDSTAVYSDTAIPSDYVSVMETAVPSSWEYMNSAEIASVASAAAAGTYPAWYNNLPASIKAVVTELGGFNQNLLGVDSSVTTAMGSSSSFHTSQAAVATTAAGTSGSAATETQASTISSTTSGAASSSKSTVPASASSTGGAPIATGSVAMSVAGAVGILGLALAL